MNIPIIGLPQIGLPLLILKAQAKNLCFLLDTGSNINALDHYCPVKAGKSVFEIVET